MLSLHSKSFPVLNKNYVVWKTFTSYATIEISRTEGSIIKIAKRVACTPGTFLSTCMLQVGVSDTFFEMEQRVRLHASRRF